MSRLLQGMVGTGLVLVAAVAQDTVQIDFRNRIPGVLDAPMFDLDGVTRLEGGGPFYAELYYGPAGTPEGALVALGTPSAFQTGANAGYWQPQLLNLPGVALGNPIVVQVRVWESIRIGALDFGVGPHAEGPVLSFAVTNTPVWLVGLKSLSLQPEAFWFEGQGTQIILKWQHLEASRYEVQATENPTTTNAWAVTSVWTGLEGYGTTLSVTNPIAGPQRFYRLLRWR